MKSSTLLLILGLQLSTFTSVEAQQISSGSGGTVVEKPAGSTFNHFAKFKNNNSCTVYIKKVTKSWTSTGGVIERVDEKNSSGAGPSYYTQNGSFIVDLEAVVGGKGLAVAPGAETGKFFLDIYTKDEIAGSVTSNFTFEYSTSCGTNCVTSASASTILTLPPASCTLSKFTPDRATNGETVAFDWNVNNPGGQLKLICGGAGFLLDKNVTNAGSQNITVPAGANHGAVIACNLNVGNSAICGDNLDIEGTPNIQIDKTDQNSADQDGVQQNDTQTIDAGDDAVFEITVTNNGTEPLKNVAIDDPESTVCSRSASQTQSLYSGSTFAPGASFSYNCTKNNVTSSTFTDGDNDISVTAQGNTSNQSVSDADPSVVILENMGNGDIKILKWAQNPNDKDGTPSGDNSENDSQSIDSGSNAIFRIQVKNIGTVDLENVRVTDDKASQCALSAAEVNDILTTGSTSKGSISNVQRFSVNNSNNILEPGEGFLYTCTQPNVVDGYENLAVTLGDPTNGNPTVSDNDPSTVLICDLTNCPTPGTPEIQIIKTDVNTNDQDNVQRNDTQTIDPGDEAVFEITVTNTGREALRDVVVTDPESPSCARNAAETQALYPGLLFDRGESFAFTCSRANVSENTFIDGDNDSFVTGVGFKSGTTVNDDDPSEVVLTPNAPVCGNNIVEPPEQCDDGNLINGDGCSDICMVEPVPTCTGADFDPDAVLAGNTSVFSWNTLNITGNVDLRCSGSAGFNLDKSVPANGTENITVPTAAALGTDTNCEIFNGNTKLCEDTLHTRNSICGDGLLETGEMCDDGNTVDGDGCSSTCELEPACVGTPFFAPNPTAPNGSTIFSWDTANTGTNVTLNCSGPAIADFTETAPSNGTRTINTRRRAVDGVGATCRLEKGGSSIPSCAADLNIDTSLPYCGDGMVNQPSEQCDDGNDIDDDSCSNTCQINTPPYDIQILKWARNDDDKDGVITGDNTVNDTQTVESITDNNLDKAVFRIQVRNVGTESLKNVRVEDANAAVCALNENEVREILNTGASTKAGITEVVVQNEVTNDDILQSGEGFEYNCTLADVRDGFTNTAVAVGTPVDDRADVNDSDPSAVVVCNGPHCPPTGDPSITIDKTDENQQDFDGTQGDDSQLIGANTTAAFKITVTNNGGESLKSVIVSDDEAPSCVKTASETQALYPGNTFDVGETFTYTCDKPNANDGDFDGANAQGSVDGHNDARVDAQSIVDDAAVNDEDPSEVLFIPQCTPVQGEINIVKDDSTPGQGDTDGDDTQQITNGGTANFTIIVSNPGTSVISEVSVSDSLSPTCARTRAEFMTLLGAEGNNDGNLDPGEVVTYTCEETNVTVSFTNSATVSGQVVTAPCAVTKTDTTEVVVTNGPGGFCGDGVIDPGEECDNGPSNGMNGNACQANCTLAGGGGGTGVPTPTVGSCAFNESTGAALCTGKKPVEDVSDEYWQKYRKCYYGEPGGYDVTGVVAPTLEKACAMRWAEDKGLALCGPIVGGYKDPFGTPTAAEILDQCDPTQPPIPCTPVNTPCPECFKAGNSIVKQVRPADLSGPLATTTTVAKGENAKYQVTLNISDFDYSTHQILDAKVRVYDQTIPTKSGNVFNRQGILDGDGNDTWKWCDENALCPEFGEYFYQVLDGATIAKINATGGTTLEVHYDMDTDVASTKDTANIKNVAYAMIYYTYAVIDPVTKAVITTDSAIAGFGDNICQPTPPTKISQLAQGTFGSVANVNIIRPFVQAKAGNAGYFSTNEDKAFADQQAIYDDTGLLTPTVLNQGVTITGNTNLDVYEGEQVGDAADFGQFQTDKEAFYANVDAATGSTDQPVPGTGLSFKQVGSANVFQVEGDLNVADLEGLSESATFIVSSGDVIMNDTDNKIEFSSGVFPAFIIRDGDLLIDAAVTDMQGMYLVEQGEIKSAADAVSTTQLRVSGNLYGDLGHLLAYRRYIGSGATIEPSIEINFDVRLLENTPPMLQQFLGDGWKEAVQE